MFKQVATGPNKDDVVKCQTESVTNVTKAPVWKAKHMVHLLNMLWHKPQSRRPFSERGNIHFLCIHALSMTEQTYNPQTLADCIQEGELKNKSRHRRAWLSSVALDNSSLGCCLLEASGGNSAKALMQTDPGPFLLHKRSRQCSELC